MEIELHPISEKEASRFGRAQRYAGSMQIGNVTATVTTNRLSPVTKNRLMMIRLRYKGPDELIQIINQMKDDEWKKFEPYKPSLKGEGNVP